MVFGGRLKDDRLMFWIIVQRCLEDAWLEDSQEMIGGWLEDGWMMVGIGSEVGVG